MAVTALINALVIHTIAAPIFFSGMSLAPGQYCGVSLWDGGVSS